MASDNLNLTVEVTWKCTRADGSAHHSHTSTTTYPGLTYQQLLAIEGVTLKTLGSVGDQLGSLSVAAPAKT